MLHVVIIKFDGVGLTSFTSQKEQEKENQKRLSRSEERRVGKEC